MDIQEYFKTMVQTEASDLYLTVNRPPMYRIQGKIKPDGDRSFTPDEVHEIAMAIMNEKQQREFAETMEMNMAMSLPGVSRFRVNIFQQRGSVGLVPNFFRGPSCRAKRGKCLGIQWPAELGSDRNGQIRDALSWYRVGIGQGEQEGALAGA